MEAYNVYLPCLLVILILIAQSFHYIAANFTSCNFQEDILRACNYLLPIKMSRDLVCIHPCLNKSLPWWLQNADFSNSRTSSTFTSQSLVFYYNDEPSFLPLYLPIYYHCELMDAYFSSVVYNLLLSLIILVIKLFHILTVGTPPMVPVSL